MIADATPFSQILEHPLHYLWLPFLPRGRISLIAADPGFGKTALVLHIAARLSLNLPVVPPPPQEDPNPIRPVQRRTPPGAKGPLPPTILLLSPAQNPHDT